VQKKGPSSRRALQELQRVTISLAGRIPAAVFLVITVDFPVIVVVNAVIADFWRTAAAATAATAGRVAAAVTVGAVDIAIAVIVDPVIAGLGGPATATADRVAVAVLLVRAIHLVVAVIIDAVVTDLGFTACLAYRCAGALVVGTLHPAVTVVVGHVITDFRGPGNDEILYCLKRHNLTYLSAFICYLTSNTMTFLSGSRLQPFTRQQGRPVLELKTSWCSG
jgi:hypothetical protein